MNVVHIFLYFAVIAAVLTVVLAFIQKPKNYIISFCQNYIGSYFIFSGFIKLIDPLGFSYKLSEYFEVFGMKFLDPFSFPLACFVTILEAVLGVALIVGYLPLTMIGYIGLNAFFTFLTWYSAQYNKVTDCGCFGDFMKLHPWTSFKKDLFLDIFIITLFVCWRKITTFRTSAIAGGITVAVSLALIALQYYCYQHLPIIDFRAYKPGTNIKAASIMPPGAPEDIYETTFLMRNLKTKEKVNMTQGEYFKIWKDTLTWDVDSSYSILVKEGYHPPIHDFVLSHPVTGVDITDSILSIKGKQLFVVMYDIAKTDREADTWTPINTLAKDCAAKGISMIALFSGAGDVNQLKTQTLSPMTFINCDGTALKTMIRSNPGIILLDNGTVTQMWHHNDTPSLNEILKP